MIRLSYPGKFRTRSARIATLLLSYDFSFRPSKFPLFSLETGSFFSVSTFSPPPFFCPRLSLACTLESSRSLRAYGHCRHEPPLARGRLLFSGLFYSIEQIFPSLIAARQPAGNALQAPQPDRSPSLSDPHFPLLSLLPPLPLSPSCSLMLVTSFRDAYGLVQLSPVESAPLRKRCCPILWCLPFLT